MDNGGDRKDPRKAVRFNIYWIYALIAVVLIGFQLFRGFTPDALPTSREAFIDSMLRKGYVQNYLVVKNKGVVRVTLKEQAFTEGMKQEKQKYEWSIFVNEIIALYNGLKK
jgi:cell division protease FtsH